MLDLAVSPDGAVFLALRELTGGPPDLRSYDRQSGD